MIPIRNSKCIHKWSKRIFYASLRLCAASSNVTENASHDVSFTQQNVTPTSS